MGDAAAWLGVFAVQWGIEKVSRSYVSPGPLLPMRDPFTNLSRFFKEQYALTEASYVTVRILQEFEGIESRDPEPWKEGLSISVCSKNGAKVGLTPRKE